ncbi:MAG: sulfatase [Actinomycetes bacterium]
MRRLQATKGRPRAVASTVLTLLAGLAVWGALVLPARVDHLSPSLLLHLPVEAIVLVGIALVLPARARPPAAVILGLVLALVVVLKVVNIGFVMVLDRPFDPAIDWTLIEPGVDVLRDTDGAAVANGAVVAAVLGVVAAVTLLPLAALRLSKVAVAHKRGSLVAGAALGLAWTLAFVTGLQLSPADQVASASAAQRVYDDVRQVRAGLEDRAAFEKEIASDKVTGTPDDRLLTGLAGKDVLLVFTESYGRAAVQDPSISPDVARVLDAGTRRLAEVGFFARSGFLTSPTFGAGSWFAHATMQSGLWVDNQQRYDELLGDRRMTLTSAFGRAGWRTVFALPSVTSEWPEGKTFYRYERLLDKSDTGYVGPRFGWSLMPDQYVLDAFRRIELEPENRDPVMAEIDLSSSHHPWTPLPELVPWRTLGDGSVFGGMRDDGLSAQELLRDPEGVRGAYGRSVVYSLSSLISFVRTWPDPDLVVVMLGDHEPWSYISGPDATHDVPVTILAHDPAVLHRVADWGWEDGLRPGPDAPVWRMDSFRDRFLTAFGPH